MPTEKYSAGNCKCSDFVHRQADTDQPISTIRIAIVLELNQGRLQPSRPHLECRSGCPQKPKSGWSRQNMP